MAEAQTSELLNQSNLFYCHKCFTDIVPQLPDYVCPLCHSGFIEPSGSSSSSSSSSSSDAGASGRLGPSQGSYDQDNDDHSTGSSYDGMEELEPNVDNLSNLLFGGAGLNPFLVSGGSSDGVTLGSHGGTAAGGSSSSGAARQPNRTRVLNALLMGPPNRRNRMRGPNRHQVLGPMIQDLIVHFSGAPVGLPLFTDELAANPGDYVWGRGGLDAVITHLMSQLENSGPPPLSQTQIGEIPNVIVTEEHCRNSMQCSVCMEDFAVEETVKKLRCEHLFHENCITPWLQMHATCPVCRKTLNDSPAGTSGASSSSSSSSSSSNSSSRSGGGGRLQQAADPGQPSGGRLVLTPSQNGHTFVFTTSFPSESFGPATTGAPGTSGPDPSDVAMMEEDLD